ncbi:MAG: hypothetical protein QW175_07370 [Candidatus Bathyarchaeia archaeon]
MPDDVFENMIIKLDGDKQFAELVDKLSLKNETVRICYKIGYDTTYKTVKIIDITPQFLVVKELDKDGKKGTLAIKLANVEGFRVV